MIKHVNGSKKRNAETYIYKVDMDLKWNKVTKNISYRHDTRSPLVANIQY